MFEDLGQHANESQHAAFLGDPASVTRGYSERTVKEVDRAIEVAANAATAILKRYCKLLDEDARLLPEKATLLPDELPHVDVQHQQMKHIHDDPIACCGANICS